MDVGINIPAQIVGAVAVLIWLYSIRQKDMKSVAFYQTIANAIYGIQYLMLIAVSAAGMNFISFIRCYFTYEYLKRDKKPPKYLLILPTILVLIIGGISFGIPTYQSFLLTFIPVFITLAYIYSLWQENLLITYRIVFVCAIIWIIYNIFVGAYILVLGNILEVIFSLQSIKQFKLNTEKELQKQKRKMKNKKIATK